MKLPAFKIAIPLALLVGSVVALAAAALTPVPAGASQATECPRLPASVDLLQVEVGHPLDAVVARVDCLPLNETLSSVTIDWGDGKTSPGTATFQTDIGATSQTASIHGRHTYTTGPCVVGKPCLPDYTPSATVVTASDGATRVGGGYGVIVETPPTLALGRKAPSVHRHGRRLEIDPHVRATCPADYNCTAKVIVRKRRGGAIIATTTTNLIPRTSTIPSVILHGTAAKALLAGSNIPVRIIVSIHQHSGYANSSAERARLANLQLRHA